ncbi:MAG: hypothetical protein HRT45_11345, partial [Bdellovibrionales bacterium]|nr:hypothetical protein [Bdellovibrionales bacterium]
MMIHGWTFKTKTLALAFVAVSAFIPSKRAIAGSMENAVLFIDTNNNPGEIRAARQAVAARNAANPGGPQEVLVAITATGVTRYQGETLTVNGSERRLSGGQSVQMNTFQSQLSAADQAALDDLNTRIQAVNEQFSGLSEGSNLYTQLEGEYNALVREQRRYTANGSVNKFSIEQTLRDLSCTSERAQSDAMCANGGTGVDVSSIVLSGHQADRAYFGVSGGVTQDQMEEIFSNPEFADHNESVLSMVLPACYSCTIGTSSIEWSDAFPNREFTFGYNPLAPLGHVPAGQNYIYEMLKGEAELRAEFQSTGSPDMNNLGSVSQLLRTMMPSGVADRATVCIGGAHVEDSICDEVYFQDGEARCIELETECRRVYAELQALAPIYESYNRGERVEGAPTGVDYSNPPTQTSRSRLRTFYNLVNDYINCGMAEDDEGNPLFESEGVPAASAVVSLIFFQKVMDNFLDVYSDDLAGSLQGLEYILGQDRARIDALIEADGDAQEIARLEQRHAELRSAVAELRDVINRRSSRSDIVKAVENMRSWYAANAEAPQALYDGRTSAA